MTRPFRIDVEDGLALGSEVFKEHVLFIGKGGREISGSDKLRAKSRFRMPLSWLKILRVRRIPSLCRVEETGRNRCCSGRCDATVV